MHYLCLAFFAFIFAHTPVSADSQTASSALSASPAILETVLKTNEATTTSVTLQNNTNFPLPIKGSVSAFLATEDIPEHAKDTYNASRWFTLEPADFILQPNEVKKIQVTINTPKNAEPGGHYATLYFRPLIPQEAVSAGGAISLARIGVLAMMIVPGDTTESLSASPVKAPSWSSFGPVKFWSTLTNHGTLHLLPNSTLTVKNMWGIKVAEIKSPPTLVLPQTTKEHNLTWDLRFGFGPYTATLTTIYGTDQTPLVSEPVTTWLIPWPIILSIFVLLTFIYKIFIVNRRRLVLALRVLRGQYELPETIQKNTRHHPNLHPRAQSPHKSPKHGGRRPRR